MFSQFTKFARWILEERELRSGVATVDGVFRWLPVMLVMLCMAQTGLADSVTLKNGQVLQGTYLGGSPRQIRVEIGNAIQVVNVSEVSRIVFSHPSSGNLSAAQTSEALVASGSSPMTISELHKASIPELWEKRTVLQSDLESAQKLQQKLSTDIQLYFSSSQYSERERRSLTQKKNDVDGRVKELLRERKAINNEIIGKEASSISPANALQGVRLTELTGTLGRRREDDLWLLRNVSAILNGEFIQEKLLAYCLVTIKGAERLLQAAPAREFALQPDGTVSITPVGPPPTREQQFRDNQRLQLELETGGGPLVQECAGAYYWFGTWNNQPIPSDQEFIKRAAKTVADLDDIDRTLDPRLVEALPQKP